jgi:ABC-2 type transport system ATP-binding protein
MNNILEVKELKKTFNSFSLDNISFSLQENCITGFIGINGAGKTTTMKSILGLISKDGGDISIFGKHMKDNEREIKNRIGVVMDEGYFYDNITIKQMKNIIAPAYSNWDDNTFNQYIERFNLKVNQKIETLSKGMRMKFALSLALSHNADLLIMDEPTSGLDPLIRNELMDILLEFMKEDGKAVLFSTHILSDLDKVADIIIIVDDGKIILEEEKDILLDTYGLVKGDVSNLNSYNKKLFLSLKESPYGFEGITNDKETVNKEISGVIIQRPTIEDIMLAYIGGNKNVI